jgi:uracil-DNA glycosylase family 4
MSHLPLDILKWLEDIGADTPLADQPIDRFAEAREELERKSRPKQSAPTLQSRAEKLKAKGIGPASQGEMARKEVTLPDQQVVKSARELARSAATLDTLRQIMGEFEGCNLKKAARNLVFADGNPEAEIMLVGEGPGRDEDIQGLPFVGRSGQLLDRMLAAIGLDRTSVYISNIIPWRPPGNRTPTPAEIEICRPFIERHIELIDPKLLVLVGGTSAKMLLNTSEGITKIRGQWRQYEINGREIDTIATLHPAYLLRQPAQKRDSWHDLIQIRERAVALGIRET